MHDKLMVGWAVVALCGFVLGCSAHTGTGDASHQGPAEEAHVHGEADAHSHAAEGPHGGHLIVLGNEEYHAELVHDEGTHTVTVHLLDASMENPISAGSAISCTARG